MAHIYLISCVAEKAAQACAAKDLYQSTLFRLSRAFAEKYVDPRNGDRWYILSAWWGLLDPEDEIAPYDLTLNKMSKADRQRWAAYVIEQLERIPGVENACLVFLAGSRYREFLLPWAGARAEIPLQGLKIGEQLSWLKGHTS